MKKIISFFLLLTILIVGFGVKNIKEVAYASSESAEVVLECQTRRILHEKNKDVQLPMASTTKVLTAILIAEECDMNQFVSIPKQAVGVEGSSVYLKEDEKIKVKDLLYCLMLRSGNDSAVALAIHHSGSIEKFAENMNEFAHKIGVHNSNFTNPHGLHNDEHYTTAYDLALITCYAMNNATFKEIVSTKSVMITNGDGEQRYLVNKNKMLTSFDGANGVKTGYTTKAGRCLVSSVEREQNKAEIGSFKASKDMQVVCVVLNVYDMFERSKELIDTAFNDYTNCILSTPEKHYNYEDKTISTHANAIYPLKNDELQLINFNLQMNSNEKKEKGAKCGKLKINLQNQLIFMQNLYYN